MRHTSLNTTSRYTRTVTERMKAAVQNLGKPLEASLGGKSIRKTTQNDKLTELRVRLLSVRNTREKSGGGEWSRTTDAADMSRVDSDETTLH